MITTLTSKGQTVVPAPLRRKFHIEASCKLEWLADGDSIRVIPLGTDTVKMARGLARGSRLMEVLMEERRKERARG